MKSYEDRLKDLKWKENLWRLDKAGLTHFRIEGPYFVSGGEFNNKSRKVRFVAPIVKYMRGWHMDAVQHHCAEKNWELEVYE